MLFLMFSLGTDRYVLDAGEVEAILPLMATKALPGAPRGVVGAINYRGRPVPLIDLNVLTLGRPAAAVLSTRIILVRYPAADGDIHLLGLIAERATETIERAASDFVASGVEAGIPAYLGPVASDARGLIQRVRTERLLPADIRDILFRRAETD